MNGAPRSRCGFVGRWIEDKKDTTAKHKGWYNKRQNLLNTIKRFYYFLSVIISIIAYRFMVSRLSRNCTL
jgi:hypothetical protein